MNFTQLVFGVVKKIPRGKVMTYAQVASAIGKPKSARAVGNALNKNIDYNNIPCHRVIRSDGFVGGYNKGSNIKAILLKKEGFKILKGVIV
jgi:methylated-DNA-[protein]-cysteine S-methyltransferase